ncbi:MAG: protein kinase [Leptolyngbyaceae cyanobacterium RU_5_1]|nr:protein kinase [Leptolyngbyaceae cyanobacterium RU_5_1]
MTYCINPRCQHRHNSEDGVCCQSCGTSLLIRDRYRLITPLRECNGHYIEVFEVQDLQNQDTPKVLKVVTNDDTQILKLFRQEHQILTNLNHEGIPRGEDAFSICLNDKPPLRCLVMQKIQGQTLEQWLEQHGAITEAQAINWLTQITKILLFIHQKNLFHRDIKPSNIMLQTSGQLVLIDFGTARQLTETVIGNSRVTIVYSGGYTAPEQLEGEPCPNLTSLRWDEPLSTYSRANIPTS